MPFHFVCVCSSFLFNAIQQYFFANGTAHITCIGEEKSKSGSKNKADSK